MGDPEGESSARKWLAAVLALGLIHGLIYVFLTPPWQHYDEPTHFEYAWLAANRVTWPVEGEFDQRMRREVAASMLENQFFRGLAFEPNLVATLEPTWIGISQLGDMPLYYWLTSLPLRVFWFTGVETQLYIGRLVSVGLLLLSLAAAWGMMKEITPHRYRFLVWLAPGMMAMLPGFVELMTAVNNDTLAVALFSWFLWGCVRLIRRGKNWGDVVWVAALGIGCVFTKSTVWVAAPLAGLALLLGAFRERRRWAPWVIAGLVTVGLVPVFFTWGNAAAWTSTVPPKLPARQLYEDAPLGDFAFTLDISARDRNPNLKQIIPMRDVEKLRGKTVTLGAWVWSNASGQASIGLSGENGWKQITPVETKISPRFIAVRIVVPEESKRLWIELRAVSTGEGIQASQVYLDGVVLAEGNLPERRPPEYYNTNATGGRWAGKDFINLARNASGELGWLEVRAWVIERLDPNIPISLNVLTGALGDPWGARWYYRDSAANLLRTFWAQFGWGHITLPQAWMYPLLGVLSGVGMLSAGIYVWKRRLLQEGEFALLATAMLVVWMGALLRGINSLFETEFLPAARYAYPVIIPTVMALVVGWYLIGRGLLKQRKLPSKTGAVVFWVLAAALAVYALGVQAGYYYAAPGG